MTFKCIKSQESKQKKKKKKIYQMESKEVIKNASA